MPVYIIRCGDTDRVKIGWAKNVETRRRQLQVNHPETLYAIRIIEGVRRMEVWLQRRYVALRLIGEWFQFNPEMLIIEPPGLGVQEPEKPPKAKKEKPPKPQKERPQSPISWAANRCTMSNLCAECLGLSATGVAGPYWSPRRIRTASAA